MDELARAIEAIVMVSDTPVPPGFLAEFLEITPARAEELCEELARSYRDEDRGFVLARVAGGYRYQSHPDLAGYLERYALEGQHARLSPAAMETLAIVAYKQPVSRAQVTAIRGVNAEGAMRTLAQRGYITEVARDPGPGQAVLYGTTTLLLEKLGLDDLGQLPPLADFVPGPEIMEALEHGLLAARKPDAGEAGAGEDRSAPAEDAPAPAQDAAAPVEELEITAPAGEAPPSEGTPAEGDSPPPGL